MSSGEDVNILECMQKNALVFKEISQSGENTSDSEVEILAAFRKLAWVEHRRWRAIMRTEGF